MTQAVNTGNAHKITEDEELTKLMEKTGYKITQENGQRKFGPPPDWTGPPPAKGSEVFVGKLPRDVDETELVPIFEKIGRIYEIRLMMEFDGTNRGYAFVMFTSPEDAKKAVRELDNYEIRKNRFIGVCKSVDNCRLFVGGIPKTKTKEDILTEMRKITDNVQDVILYSSISDKSKNRGFAFVEYESHKSAAMARRKLMGSPGKIQLWGHDIAVDWAEPEPEVDEVTMSKVTVLYARNLMMSTTEEKLKEIFSHNGTLKVDKVKKLRDFAFVHYEKRQDAERALKEINNTDIDGSVVEVRWAKPVDRSTRQKVRPGTGQPVHPLSLCHYPLPGLDPCSGLPFAYCPGAGVLQRLPVPRRGRGAAGIRRFRSYSGNVNRPANYKPPEVPGAGGPPPPYVPYQQGKMNRIPEEGKAYYPSEYVYVPISSSAEGLDNSIAAVTTPGFIPYSTHARIATPGYLPPSATYEDGGYYTYYQPPPGAVAMY